MVVLSQWVWQWVWQCWLGNGGLAVSDGVCCGESGFGRGF